MTYDVDLTWDEIANELRVKKDQLMRALREAKASQEEWNSFRAGETDAQVATRFVNNGRTGTTAAEVGEMKSAFTSFKDVFDFCDNVASPVQGNRFADWRKF